MTKEMALQLLKGKDVYLTDEGRQALELIVKEGEKECTVQP